MESNYKPGGGNKPQPYVPAGNGEKSGEYTDKPTCEKKNRVLHCFIRNVPRKCNFRNSKLVQTVTDYSWRAEHVNIPSKHKANSVIKKIVNGYVVTERYYNNKGEAYLDIDYTCHGRPNVHPEVPHIHKWTKDENGNLHRGKWENFQWEENVLKN